MSLEPDLSSLLPVGITRLIARIKKGNLAGVGVHRDNFDQTKHTISFCWWILVFAWWKTKLGLIVLEYIVLNLLTHLASLSCDKVNTPQILDLQFCTCELRDSYVVCRISILEYNLRKVRKFGSESKNDKEWHWFICPGAHKTTQFYLKHAWIS